MVGWDMKHYNSQKLEKHNACYGGIEMIIDITILGPGIGNI